MTRWSIIFVLALAPSLAYAAGPTTLPSTEDVKATYEKGEYAETLKLLGRILSLKGKAAEGIDRYAMLMLKAESHLKLKATTNAIDALEDAVKTAKAAEDEKAAADAIALVMLIKRSKNLQYTPKVVAKRGGGGPIDITDLKRRPEALEALYIEEKALLKPRVQEAQKSKTLPPIATALKSVVALKSLELAGTGRDGETEATTKELVDRAHKLMAKGLDDMVERTVRISENADELVTQSYTRPDGSSETRTYRQGLAPGDSKVLQGMIDDCKKIVKSCKELTEGFTDDTEPFEDLEDQAKDVGERAHDVMTDNYSTIR
jgi:hypothetical protein